mgnify:FL=1
MPANKLCKGHAQVQCIQYDTMEFLHTFVIERGMGVAHTHSLPFSTITLTSTHAAHNNV